MEFAEICRAWCAEQRAKAWRQDLGADSEAVGMVAAWDQLARDPRKAAALLLILGEQPRE